LVLFWHLLGIPVFYEKRKINTGGTQVKINVDIDDKYKDTQITIQANECSPEIQRLIDFINQQKPDRLFGVDGEQTVLLDPNEIDFIHVENRITYASMKEKHMQVSMKIVDV